MGNVSVWFLILLVIVSGVIALVGDVLGRRLGKKRLRIGRLRPKHTAFLMTFIAGMVMTVFTILSLSLLSEPVRTWLIEGDKLQGRLAETQKQVENSEKEVDAVKSQLVDERSKLATEQERVKVATEESKKLSEAAATLRNQVQLVTRQLTTSMRQFNTVQIEYKQVKVDADKMKTSIAEFSKQQEDLMKQNRVLMAQADSYSESIDRLSGQITLLQADAKEAEEDKILATGAFNEEKRRIQEERTMALADLTKTSLELTEARRNLTALQMAASNLFDDNVRSRFNPLMFNRGDELARLPVRSKLSQSEAQSYLVTVIESASKDAIQRGAERAPDSRTSAAFMTYNSREGSSITAEMQFNQAVSEIAAKPDDQVIVVRALNNAFTGEWVPIRVDVYPNPIVYQLGDLVIETRVDGTKGVQGVTKQIVEFIARQLRDRAIKDGMVPATGRQPELGEISQEELQLVVGEIVQANRTVSLRIHARKEARASDSLSLDLRPR